ncbi:MAG: hypothetical protein HY512_02360 [Candidatus Aenigmarchaeota archaeon]|nr:hypothetical protein [Candidatus Aenigmarchaeota archaeon]
MIKRKTNQKVYRGVIAVLVLIIVVLSAVIMQNGGKQQTQSQLPSVESDIKTTSQAKAASDETLTSISEIKTLLDGMNDVLSEK